MYSKIYSLEIKRCSLGTVSYTHLSKLFTGKKLSVQRGQGLKAEFFMRLVWLATKHPDVFKKNLPVFVVDVYKRQEILCIPERRVRELGRQPSRDSDEESTTH